MIARLWHGRVNRAKADAYQDYVSRTGLVDYRQTPGNRGAWLLRRDEGDITHFTTLSFWDSLAAVEGFAGSDYELARYYPEDDEFLLERELKVQHHVVVGD